MTRTGRTLLYQACVIGLVLAAAACGQRGPERSTPVVSATPKAEQRPEATAAASGYELTHSQRDAEFLLSWDLIAATCPKAGEYQVNEAFARRGETVDISPEESLSVEQDAPLGWVSQRFVRVEDPTSGQSLGVTISFFDGPGTVVKYLEALVGPMRASVAEAGGFAEASVDSKVPLRVTQRFVAGNGIILHLVETAAPDVAYLCEPASLSDLLSAAKGNMALVTANPSQ